jgi:predicted MFS family arabinose efflux permease
MIKFMIFARAGVGRLVLPSLLVSRFVIGVPPLLVSLLLIEIGETFGQSVGAAGQMSKVSSAVASLHIQFLVSDPTVT